MSTIRNSVSLIGNLGRDIETRELRNGNTMAKTSIAVNEYYTDKNGEKQVSTQWFNIVGFGKTAELMEKILQKGQKVSVTGKLQYNEYETEQGGKRKNAQIVVNQFLNHTRKSA